MTYLLILPCFGLYVVIFGLVILGSRLVDGHFSPGQLAVFTWSCGGFILANVACILTGVILVQLASVLSPTSRTPSQTFAALFLFFFPLVVSPAGLLGGAVFGLRRLRKRQDAA